MPCRLKKGEKACAHEAGKYLEELNAGEGAHQRYVNGIIRCSCGLPLRAKEVRSWAINNGTKVNNL